MPVVRLFILSLCMHRAANAEDEAHFHSGRLVPYEIGPPSVLLSQQDEATLRSGQPVMQAMEGARSAGRRLLMVQDVPAPHHIVLGRIVDFERYDKMVSGVDSCVNYACSEAGGVQTVCSAYEISAAHLKLKYFVEHTYDPSARCMTFRLDYDRRSDLDDSVGYWYVEPRGSSACRVYYSCECQLRGWVPPPVLNILTKEALKKATTWVHTESVREWRSSRDFAHREALVRFVSGVREGVREGLQSGFNKLPPTPPLFVSNLLSSQRRAATRFVSAVRAPKPARRV